LSDPAQRQALLKEAAESKRRQEAAVAARTAAQDKREAAARAEAGEEEQSATSIQAVFRGQQARKERRRRQRTLRLKHEEAVAEAAEAQALRARQDQAAAEAEADRKQEAYEKETAGMSALEKEWFDGKTSREQAEAAAKAMPAESAESAAAAAATAAAGSAPKSTEQQPDASAQSSGSSLLDAIFKAVVLDDVETLADLLREHFLQIDPWGVRNEAGYTLLGLAEERGSEGVVAFLEAEGSATVEGRCHVSEQDGTVCVEAAVVVGAPVFAEDEEDEEDTGPTQIAWEVNFDGSVNLFAVVL
jgi:hypothetical protein